MLRVHAGSTERYCDGYSRRSFVQLGVAGMGAASLGDVLRAKAAAAHPGGGSKDTSVILIWLDGGPSHMDLYDLKPEAPVEYRGIWNPIPTNVSAIQISELFPLQATIADKFSIVRSLYHNNGDHFAGGHLMLTSRPGASGLSTPSRYPSIGSLATRITGPRRSGMPPYVAVPYGMSIGLRPGYFGAHYLGNQYNPFETEGDPNAANFQVNNLSLQAALSLDRLDDRRGLLRNFDRIRRDVDDTGALESLDEFDRRAYSLVTGDARRAFDISLEDPRLRDRYGRTHWGQSNLLARRLVEAGSTFVTVHYGGWDHHWDLQAGMERYLPQVDQAVYGLITDLEERGLLEKTLVVLCGEFSRTPRMNDGGNGGAPRSMGTPGRDHWGNSSFVFMAGGGVQGGRIVGSTTRLGDAPKDNPYTPADLHATIYQVLGVDPTTHFLNHQGRPVPLIDSGKVMQELFA